MQLSILPALVIAALFAVVQSTKVKYGYSTQSEFCYTSFSTKKTTVVPTTTHYITKTATSTSTKYTKTTTTVTPNPTTTTVTNTVTSTTTVAGPTTTDTATVTSTEFTAVTITAPLSTATETDTVTETDTTSTSSTSTSTVAAPSDFVPLQTSLPGSSDSQPDSMQQKRRDLASIASIKARALLARNGDPPGVCKGPGKPNPTYPAKVSCNRYSTSTITKTTTKTQSPCTTTAKSSTVTSTASTTLTKTSTSYPPDVTATSTVTTVITNSVTVVPSTTTTTTITTTTTTTTTAVSTQTVYAQCSASNFADQDPAGSFFANADSSSPYSVSTTNANTAQACCVSCVFDANCALSGFSRTGTCYLINVNSCSAGQTSSSWAIDNTQKSSLFVYNNGACGRITSIKP